MTILHLYNEMSKFGNGNNIYPVVRLNYIKIINFKTGRQLYMILTNPKPWAKKYINSRAQKTNVDSLIGKKTILTEDIDNLRQTGKAVVMGQEWTVRTDNDGVKIPKGTLVEVINVSGVKLIVKRIKED